MPIPTTPRQFPNRMGREVQIGDRVRVVSGSWGMTHIGSYGIVVDAFDSNHPRIQFEFLALPDNPYIGNSVPSERYNIEIYRLPIYALVDHETGCIFNHIAQHTFATDIGYHFSTLNSRDAMERNYLNGRETIEQVIHRLHYRQKFYQENKGNLPAWDKDLDTF